MVAIPSDSASSLVSSTRPGAARVAHQPRQLAWPRRLALSIAVTDGTVIALALVVAQVVRFGIDGPGAAAGSQDLAYAALGLVIGIVWITALWAARTREHRIIGIGLREYQRVANATLGTFGVLAIIAFIARLDIARGYLAVALPTGLVLLLLGRVIWRNILQSLRRAGRCLTGAIIVGPAADVASAVAELTRNLRAGYRPIAVVLTDEPPPGDAVHLLPRIPSAELVSISKRTRTRAVMIAGELPGGRQQIRDLGWALENSRVELILVSRLTDVAGPRIHLRPVEGLPMVHVDLPQYSGFNHTVKRGIDLVIAGTALLMLAPLLVVIAVVVRIDSRGPALFRQERVGVQGAKFTMLKFRSMIVDAEQRRAELSSGNQGSGPLFKLKDDPRVTGVGAFLRRYSLDELPQLWNVLVGDMSLVGPRPPLPGEVAQYEERVNRRLLTKPGITGLWQVSGRSDLSWEDSVKIDLYYVENWSVTSDFLILLRTVRAVFRRNGAY